MEALILNIACEFVGSYNVETVGLYTTAASTGNIDIDYCYLYTLESLQTLSLYLYKDNPKQQSSSVGYRTNIGSGSLYRMNIYSGVN